jgi:hypothetical protein
MQTELLAHGSFRVVFESAEELAAVERASLGVGGLLLTTAVSLPPDSAVALTLRLADGPEVGVRAKVVAALPNGLALEISGHPQELLAALRAPSASVEGDTGKGVEGVEEVEAVGEVGDAPSGTIWEQVRRMTPPQRMLLAPKADRLTRTILVQDSDPQVLFALLKNPRLGIDEVLRIAKSSFLSFQAAELILKTNPWFANLDIRVALIHNPKLPTPFALRILPTLPESEVRPIAKGSATSMPLKQAALRRLQGGK